ncbi:MAG: type II toxin-antitoxin system prevent-host-death family antitoxin [Sphingopyxis sp.]|nr:type II toxin-antitoxin system prevent-host-death family antitoxin [Sphingopyxis sp.]
MTTVTVHQAKTHMSRLLARVEAGEEIIIARGKHEIAKLVPLEPPKRKRRTPGRFAYLRPEGSRGILDNGFWDPLTDEEMGFGPDLLLDSDR